MDYVKLSKTMAHALRHAPEQYGLTMDEQGWVCVEDLMDGIFRNTGLEVHFIDIKAVLDLPGKRRYEYDVFRNEIRVYNGHSVEQKIQKEETKPPHTLYHGTTFSALADIEKTGLKPMSRQHVHLTENKQDAIKVAKRHGHDWVVLEVMAKKAHLEGVKFYFAVDNIWLSDEIPPKFLMADERFNDNA